VSINEYILLAIENAGLSKFRIIYLLNRRLIIFKRFLYFDFSLASRFLAAYSRKLFSSIKLNLPYVDVYVDDEEKNRASSITVTCLSSLLGLADVKYSNILAIYLD